VTSAAELPADIDEAHQEIQELRQALHSRSVIDQAKGLVRAWLCCTEDEAFRALTAASQTANVKVRQLAAELVALASTCDADAEPWLERYVGPRGGAESA
jgi:AmiR/NasT family two-component response regulator